MCKRCKSKTGYDKSPLQEAELSVVASLNEFEIGKVINLIANDLKDIDYGVKFKLSIVLFGYKIYW